MLGDWDLQSTLLRRAIQEGALRIRSEDAGIEPILVERAEDLDTFQRRLLQASRGMRADWVSRFLLPPVEELATERLMETGLKPVWLIWIALVLTLAATLCCLRGWLGAALILMILTAPLDIVANRLATLRLRPLSSRLASRRLLGPAAGLPLLALSWWEMNQGHGWGALLAGAGAIAFSEAMRIEKTGFPPDADPWLFSRRSAIFAAIPFALAGSWTAYLIGLLLYATVSFFIIQHVRHSQPS